MTITGLLLGLALWLIVACAAPAPVTPSLEPGMRLYTRTPMPTAVPVTPTPTLSAQALYQQGQSWRDNWDLAAALDRFDAALALNPDAQVYASRAEVYRLTSRYDEAAADVERALALDPELAQAWRQKALLNYEQAALRQAQDTAWDEALSAVNKLIELEPDNGTAYVLRARIRAEGFDKIRMALVDYERAISHDPGLAKATLVERWHILAVLERWDEALLVGHKMFATGSEDPLRYFYRGWSLIRLGQLDDAIQMLFFGIERYPDCPVALYYALGVAYFERQAWDEAIMALEVALAQSGASSNEKAPWRQLNITPADILGRLGVAYLAVGQCQTGGAIVKRTVAESSDPQAWDWAVARIEACYIALTPTPTPTLAPTSPPQGEQRPLTPGP